MTAGEHRLALPAGYQLGKYHFKSVLGAGGFGITYLAEDSSLGRRVAIKELLPNDIATRLDGSTVVAKTKGEEENLEWARDRFVKEGRALAACEHPSVVHVYEMIEANGTAYMVTKYEEGRSFSEWLKEIEGAPRENELRAILQPLLSGLEKVHKAVFLHRDLKPENIYITDDGRPILLDFGSARQAVNDRTTSLTSIVTSGYAPFEQYHEDGKQGPWTDIYALGAVIYRAIHGKKPPEATRRLKDDPIVDLSREYAGKYGPDFLTAIDKALAVDIAKRPQTVAEWRAALGTEPIGETPVVPWWKQMLDRGTALVREKPAIAAGAAVGVLLAGVMLWKAIGPGNGVKPIPQPTPAPATPTPPPNPTPSPATPTPPPASPTPKPIISTPGPTTPPPATPPQKEQTVAPPTTNAGPRPGESWKNSLGQTYLPVPTMRIHMAATEVRRMDFEAFVRATGYDATAGVLSPSFKAMTVQGFNWAQPGFPQTPQHPVVGVNAYDALEFCRWLTAKERAEGRIDQRVTYRLPTSEEWDKAAGGTLFPWGDAWPPTVGAGNYAGQEAKMFAKENRIPDYNDGFVYTAPVGTYQANPAGFYDLGGNAFEICGTWGFVGPENAERDSPASQGQLIVLRGACWGFSQRETLMTALKQGRPTKDRLTTVGFRCVLAPVDGPAPKFILPPLPSNPQEGPLAIEEGTEVVERKLVAIWESKSTNSSGPVMRWELPADGRYTLSRDGEVLETGTTIARKGRLQQQVENPAHINQMTYRFKTTTQLVVKGPLGETEWRRVKALPIDAEKQVAPETEDEKSDKISGEPRNGRSSDTQTNKPRSDNSEGSSRSKSNSPSVEKKARDVINSIRRRLPF